MKLDELRDMLLAIDPAAVLVSPSALARVVQNVEGITWAVWSIPHSHCLAIDRPTLNHYIEQEELYLPPGHSLPEDWVLLLERPSNDQLAASKSHELLGRYWRLLFHVSIHRAIEKKFAAITAAELRERIERIGTVAFEEARNVLAEDGDLDSNADDQTAYIEFVAFFLEMRFFSNNLVPVYFPSLPPIADVEAIVSRDVDGAEIFRQTRLPGAPDPTPKTDDQSDESEDFYRRLTQAAERATTSGDTVGAAILHTRAARVAPATRTKPAQARARDAIHALVDRLQNALGLTDPGVQKVWREVLPTLLDKADQGTRPVEAALLYDLQRACLDAEQTIYTLDLWEWLKSVGRKPIKRPLDSQRFVRVPEHLRSAIRGLTAARLADADRQALGALLRDALERAEVRLRERFRPVLTDALSDAGLKPSSLPEKAALEKTVEELLDRISSAGFLGYADLRDAIARGQMKLADLSGPDTALRGDPLHRLDKRLAHLLDGVYRSAELYTQGLEFMTSMAFGTQTGRWVTQNIALPFGGAFLVSEFVWLLVYEQRFNEWDRAQESTPKPLTYSPSQPAVLAGKTQESVPKPLPVAPIQPTATGIAEKAQEPALKAQPGVSSQPSGAVEKPDFLEGWNAAWAFHITWILLGLVFLAAIRSVQFRSTLIAISRFSYRFSRALFWDLPLNIWSNPIVRYVVRSVPAQILFNYVGKPLLVCAVLWPFAADYIGSKVYIWFIIFVVSNIVINSTAVDILLVEVARKIIELVRAGPAVIRWINQQFVELLDALDWMMARTEDWLRIRGPGGPMSVMIRAIASVFWTPIAFLIRFYTVVLIEPMINPVKLPLSILFAKFVYPLLALLGLIVLDPFSSPLVPQISPPMPRFLAYLLVVGTFYLSPDLVTYLFWETRENWRLYRANLPDRLRPVPVGPNGETILGLLHKSFHSGTIPRLYARLRSAELEAGQSDNWRDARTYRQALRGVAEAVHRFVMRDLVAVLNSSPAWGERKLTVGDVSLGTNRITVKIELDGDKEVFVLEWEDRSGWLVAGCIQTGFLPRLPPEAVRVFENSVVYLYKRAGVDLIREQIQDSLPKEAVHFDIASNGLLVWYGSRDTIPVLYDPDEPVDELPARDPIDRHLVSGQTLEAIHVVFGRLELTWRQWLAVWMAHGRPEPPRFGPSEWYLRVLPPGGGGRVER